MGLEYDDKFRTIIGSERAEEFFRPTINTEEEQYGTDRMLNVLSRYSTKPENEMLRAVKRDMDRFVGEADQFDDITMLGFRFNGNVEDTRKA